MNCQRFLSIIIVIFFIGSALWSRLEDPLSLADKCLKMRACKHGFHVTYLHLLNYFREMFHRSNRKFSKVMQILESVSALRYMI